MWFEIVN